MESVTQLLAHRQTLSQPHPSIKDCLTYQINKPHGQKIAILCYAHERGVCAHTRQSVVCELRATG